MSPDAFSDLAAGDRLHLPAEILFRVSLGAVVARVGDHNVTITPDMLTPERVLFGGDEWNVACRVNGKIGIWRPGPPGGADPHVFVDANAVHPLQN